MQELLPPQAERQQGENEEGDSHETHGDVSGGERLRSGHPTDVELAQKSHNDD